MDPLIDSIVVEVSKVVQGKTSQIKMALACLLSQGHLLIEDLPGMGKTTLAESLAKVLGLRYSRVQFTSDLLPADITGVSIFHQTRGAFEFQPGPIFTQVLLADEINRSSPKTQSALLEAMEEKQVTADGTTHPLPRPFFVIATQNPFSQDGTFPLPESQLDRFTMRISLGYPSQGVERSLLSGNNPKDRLTSLIGQVTEQQIESLLKAHESVELSDSVLDYVQRLIDYTRTSPDFAFGISTRAGISLTRCARIWAWMHGRGYVIPEDIQLLLPSVVGHRVKAKIDHYSQNNHSLILQVLEHVDVLQ